MAVGPEQKALAIVFVPHHEPSLFLHIEGGYAGIYTSDERRATRLPGLGPIDGPAHRFEKWREHIVTDAGKGRTRAPFRLHHLQTEGCAGDAHQVGVLDVLTGHSKKGGDGRYNRIAALDRQAV